MALPSFREDGWLPEGHHLSTWEEIIETFGGEPASRRARIMADLLAWRDTAREKGFSGLIVLDGSFISQKAEPGDFDLIFVYDEMSETIVAEDSEARLLLGGSACRERFHGDIFPFSARNVRDYPAFCRIDGFDCEKHTIKPKGVIEVML